MFESIVFLLAQEIARNNRGLGTYHAGLTAVGIAIILVAFGFLYANPKDPAKALPKALQWTVFAIVILLGLGVIASAWLAF